MADTALRSSLFIDTDLPRQAQSNVKSNVAPGGFLERASKILAARLNTPTEDLKKDGTPTAKVASPTWGNTIYKAPFQDMDMLENGHAREYLAEQCLSPSQAKSWTYSIVERMNKNQFKMFWNNDLFLLSAKQIGGTFYISQYENFPESDEAEEPTGHYCAVLRKSTDHSFKLYSCGCEGCDQSFSTFTCSNIHEDATSAAIEGADRQLLADISHYTKAAGVVGSEMRCFSVVIPAIMDDKRSRVVWCPRVSRGVTTSGGTPRGISQTRLMTSPSPRNKQQYIFTFDAPTSDRIKIGSKLPVWCPEVNSLMLKFHGGRIREASAKNFMLMLDGESAGLDPAGSNSVVLQFGKYSKSKFALDFRFPLAPIQAFAIGLSSCAWNVKATAS
ncbi:Tub family proteins [Plasmopara halstedii]|uniref:Tub family proteins n=1 Tax=Plasmopara halstedii TaxID=4781 RepID=A0A0P1AM60_PLAHL|nr:Tub family proteins [Plasmopara halstedii]CEG42402.1 Tub family proteins [Plasmopara halstedii]|eukprot:XP_024578771.1 Tub family proteins [Plasmopara halstedii]